jgi:hypothetical protein
MLIYSENYETRILIADDVQVKKKVKLSLCNYHPMTMHRGVKV